MAGQFALINTTNVEDAENSRLYIWTGSAYTFVDDLSGSAGIQGITGSQGVQGIQGIQGIQGTQGIQGIQGIQGTQGTQGIQGISGASILGTNNTFTGTNAFGTLSATGAITATGVNAFIANTGASASSKFIDLANTAGVAQVGVLAVGQAFLYGSQDTLIYGDGAVVGTFSSTGLAVTGAISDTAGDVRIIPQNSKSAAYTLVLADSGKHIFHPSADTTARTFTIPANSSVAYTIGTAVTFINQNAAGVITISITTDTMRLAGTGTTGSRTLAANGVATAVKVTSTEWIISGTGLT